MAKSHLHSRKAPDVVSRVGGAAAGEDDERGRGETELGPDGVHVRELPFELLHVNWLALPHVWGEC